MNRYTLILTFLFSLFLLSGCDSGFMSETVDYGELIERDGLYYKKFSDVPYTGKVKGEEQGSIKNGKKEGEWVWYYENGQLESKVTYKNGEREGEYVSYWMNGHLNVKATFKNGKLEGESLYYDEDGQFNWKETHKNGKKISD